MSTDKLEQSKNDGPHFRLGQITGDWEGTTRVWLEPGKVADESPVTGTIRSALNGSFLIYEYKGSFNKQPVEGIAILGYHLADNTYQCAWIDNLHLGTAIMFSRSDANHPSFSVKGSYTDDMGGLRTGLRTELAMISEDQLVITCYTIFPDGSETKLLETTYNRKK